MDLKKKEMYQYLEDLRLLCVFNEMVYARHLVDVFGFTFDEAFEIALEFSEKYDEIHKMYDLNDLFPRDKWLERQERISQNAERIKWILSEIEDIKISHIMRECKISHDDAIEMLKDAVLSYGVAVSRMQVDVCDVPDDPFGYLQ